MRRLSAVIAAIALLAAGLVAWSFVGPSQLGGGATYVTVVGSSMQPQLSRGDLVLVRRQPAYATGDVVAYRNAAAGKLVLHRIVDRAGDRYVLRGDNNGWTDSYRPAAAEIEGAQWVVLPGWGARLMWLAEPRNAAGLPAHRRHRRRRSTPACCSAPPRSRCWACWWL